MIDWGIVCLLAAYCIIVGYGQPLACATTSQC